MNCQWLIFSLYEDIHIYHSTQITIKGFNSYNKPSPPPPPSCTLYIYLFESDLYMSKCATSSLCIFSYLVLHIDISCSQLITPVVMQQPPPPPPKHIHTLYCTLRARVVTDCRFHRSVSHFTIQTWYCILYTRVPDGWCYLLDIYIPMH